MAADGSDGRINSQPDNDVTDTTQRAKNDRGRSGQATPVDRTKSNENYQRQSHKFTEEQHRAGLREVEEHASWREVYRACHVGVGVDD